MCDPGGGSKNAIYRSYDRVTIKESTWDGLDFFMPINFTGNIMITERTRNFIDENSFKNYKIIKDIDARYDIYKPVE